MKLQELIEAKQVKPLPFPPFFKGGGKFPLPEVEELGVDTAVPLEMGEDAARRFKIPLDTVAAGALLITYRKKIGGVFAMEDLGPFWNITQVQGAHSREGYRLSASMRWPSYLARVSANLAAHPKSEVQSIVMPELDEICNIGEARSPVVKLLYEEVVHALEMQFSQTLRRFIVDVRK